MSISLTPRSLDPNEEKILVKFNVIGHLNDFARWMTDSMGYPVIWKDLVGLAEVGVVDDPELSGIGCSMSLCVGFLPVLVGYKRQRGRPYQKVVSPLHGYALACVEPVEVEPAWAARVAEVRKFTEPKVVKRDEDERETDIDNRIPTTVAFPRYLQTQKIKKTDKVRSTAILASSNMLHFAQHGYQIVMRTVGGLQPRWTQLACNASTIKAHNDVEYSNKPENGMISCPDITFLRLDLHEHTKTGANPSKAPILSILFRGIIVETAKLSREWRAWRPTDEINLRSLSKVLSLRIISKPDSKPSEMTSKPRPRSCSRGRSQSPDRANVRLEKTDLRQRSIDPPKRRMPPPSPRGAEHTLSHRRRRMYGFL